MLCSGLALAVLSQPVSPEDWTGAAKLGCGCGLALAVLSQPVSPGSGTGVAKLGCGCGPHLVRKPGDEAELVEEGGHADEGRKPGQRVPCLHIQALSAECLRAEQALIRRTSLMLLFLGRVGSEMWNSLGVKTVSCQEMQQGWSQAQKPTLCQLL